MSGLAGPLPPGERLLWEGAPSWRPFTRRALALPWAALYLVALVGWGIASGKPGIAAGYGAMALVALGLLVLLGYAMARSTTYSLTTTHLVIEYGFALPKAVTIPYRRVVSAGLRLSRDGTGDIAIQLDKRELAGAVLLWPHVRFSGLRIEPALRALPEAEKVAGILARALAATAETLPAAATYAEPARGRPSPVAVAAE